MCKRGMAGWMESEIDLGRGSAPSLRLFSLFLRLFFLATSSSGFSVPAGSLHPLLSFSPSLPPSLPLTLTPDSVECRSPCLEAPLSLSLPLSLSIYSIHHFSASPSPPLGLRFLWAGCRFAGQLAWLDTAVLDMIYIAHGEHRTDTITRPGCIYILDQERELSIASSAVARRWRLSIARAQGVSCCKSVFFFFFKEEQAQNLWHRSCLLTPIQKKTTGTLHVRPASKIHHIGPNSLLCLPTFCLSLYWLAG